MADYVTLQDAVDGLRADNQALTDEVLAGNATSTTAKADAEAARTAAELAETNAKESETLAGQYKDGAEAAVPLAAQHMLDAEAQVPLAQAEKVAAEAARDTAVLTALGPDNDKLASIASVYSQPSLSLDFAKQIFWKQGTYPWNQDALDPAVDLTFARASTATYFDANGVMQTAVADEMRFDHDPVTGEPQGLLIEESRTNLLLWSEDFTQWAATDATVSSDVVVGPDGSLADKLVEGTGSSVKYIRRAIEAQADNTVLTFSGFFKAGERDEVRAAIRNKAGDYKGVIFSLTSGNALSVDAEVTDYGFKPVGNGWYWAWVALDIGADTNNASLMGITYLISAGSAVYQGDGTSGLYIWGAQLEEGSTPSSYIPTTDAPVTRAADNVSRELGGEFNPSEGTLYAEFYPGGINQNSRVILGVSDGTGSNRTLLRHNYADQKRIQFISVRDDVISSRQEVDTLVDGLNKVAISYYQSGWTLAVNGYTYSLFDVSGDVVATQLHLSNGPGSNRDASTKRAARYYPRALTEAELVELTS